ncbi:MAG: translation initiation factor 2 [Lachnospiraceae bacterium]|nr:translation initiation factor 2 [Lachnospiraceae bacterium]
MTGKYEVVLYNNKLHYELTIKRNITILRGDSASGKSEFVRLLSAYSSNPSSSGITLKCDKRCLVLTEGNWSLFTEAYNDSIFFIDEGNGFLRTKEFANAVKSADNYFVIISREKLSLLPYSIDEIYGLKEGKGAGKYRNPKRVYNEMYRIFGKLPYPIKLPDLIVTEDSDSGNEFFSILFPDKCISSYGKSNIKRILAAHPDQAVIAVVDGAAFGPEMQECMDMVSYSGGRLNIFAPESFEYLILESGIIEVPKAIMEETWEYADSAKYFSWEEFYTGYLLDTTRNSVRQYSKAKLPEFYETAGNIEKIRNILPECMRGL